jgi:hypothetical protein
MQIIAIQLPARISELPPVSVGRDWVDYFGLLFTFIQQQPAKPT